MLKFWTKNKRRTVFALFGICLALTALLLGCDGVAEWISFPEKPFFMSVEGVVDGGEISATVFCDPTEHKTKEIYNKLTVTFHSPAGLSGMTVSLRSDGKATVRLRDSEEESPLFSSMTEPYLFLFESEPYSVERVDGGYSMIVSRNNEQLKCAFDQNGELKKIKGRYFGHEIELFVTKICEK